MSPKVVSSDATHRDLHPSFYEGNHRDHYLSLLPVFMPLSFLTVPHTYSRRDPILGPKVFHFLLGLYQTLKSTHFRKGKEKLRRLRKESEGEEERMQREEECIKENRE